jgi:hypothetical protein
VFDGRNNCYVLMNQDYSDFVAVIDFTDDEPVSMYQMVNAEPLRMLVTENQIKKLIHQIEPKRNDETIYPFNDGFFKINRIEHNRKKTLKVSAYTITFQTIINGYRA